MLKIGLTGGVGCGKSTVASMFAAKGVPVLDADEIARMLVQNGQPAFTAIVAHFGEGIVLNGQIDRKQLRGQIYSNPQAKRTLESIIHPLVYQSLSDQARCLQNPYCIFAIPLLIETGRLDFVDRILVVDCLPEQQYERVRQRDRLDGPTISRIMRAQSSREQKLALADDIIENFGRIEELPGQVEKLHQAYLDLTKYNA